ncbi:hypothetical protein AADZ90_001760 [Aestuariibius sp. 2305UL40-4]|uniref:hypothetical protein n=1 Tax=Aestuariibius violaceus TaxID=3234132 RepID=UPI00345E8749
MAFDALPEGSFEGMYKGRRWIIRETRFANGRSQKIVAHELGGAGYISANLYRLASGPVLKPCEMPEAKVRAFVLGLLPL